MIAIMICGAINHNICLLRAIFSLVCFRYQPIKSTGTCNIEPIRGNFFSTRKIPVSCQPTNLRNRRYLKYIPTRDQWKYRRKIYSSSKRQIICNVIGPLPSSPWLNHLVTRNNRPHIRVSSQSVIFNYTIKFGKFVKGHTNKYLYRTRTRRIVQAYGVQSCRVGTFITEHWAITIRLGAISIHPDEESFVVKKKKSRPIRVKFSPSRLIELHKYPKTFTCR